MAELGAAEWRAGEGAGCAGEGGGAGADKGDRDPEAVPGPDVEADDAQGWHSSLDLIRQTQEAPGAPSRPRLQPSYLPFPSPACLEARLDQGCSFFLVPPPPFPGKRREEKGLVPFLEVGGT